VDLADRGDLRDALYNALQLQRAASLGWTAVGLSLLLAGCSPAKPISYYQGHGPERDARVQTCLVSGEDDADCRNAKQAAFNVIGVQAVDGKALPVG
jgi:hypothetical protein